MTERVEPSATTVAGEIDEAGLVKALQAGDEAAFRELVNRYHPPLVRLARASVGSQAVAEEVTQDTWLAVIRGIGRFEGRSSLRTWIFRILMNQARARGTREKRTVPMSSWADDDGPAVDPDRFVPDGQRWAGHWRDPPVPWSDLPAERLVGEETMAMVAEAIDDLPERQREVITLRDVEGWTALEVCNVLGLTEGNQRVLLHRARSRVRAVLEARLGGES